MRREDHRMPPDECEKLLHRAEVIRLGFIDAGEPYVVPVNFGYEDGRIYVHGAPEGRRFEAAARGGTVCFEADEGEIVHAERPCGFTSRFSSVIGYGTVRLLDDVASKRRGLGAIMRHYGGPDVGIPDAKLGMTSVVEIEIRQLDGKWHGTDRAAGDE